jgi:ribosome-binding protein aMBF1 (putative translation factor)
MFGGQSDQPTTANPEKILLRVFVYFHGDRVILLLSGYDKGDDPSERKQQKEIQEARKYLTEWQGQERRLTTNQRAVVFDERLQEVSSMSRSYEEATAERRSRLSPEAKSQLETFRQAYGLAAQVIRRRIELGWTQSQLADKSGIDQGDISRIERGVISPNEKTLLRLATSMGSEWVMVGNAAPATTRSVKPRRAVTQT